MHLQMKPYLIVRIILSQKRLSNPILFISVNIIPFSYVYVQYFILTVL